MYDLNQLLRFLDERRLPYDIERHRPVATVDEALQTSVSLAGEKCKNLFIKDSGGAFLLVLMPCDVRIDLRTLAGRLGTKRLSFANSEGLQQMLGVRPGAVSPLALINDARRMVRFVVDKRLRNAGRLLVHPLTNTATLSISFLTFLEFMTAIERKIEWMSVDEETC